MNPSMTRRDFLATSISGSIGIVSGPGVLRGQNAVERKLHNKKGVCANMLPSHLSTSDAFKLVRESGFEQVEAFTTFDENVARRNKSAAQVAGVEIGSVADSLTNWKFPLSSDQPDTVKKALAGQAQSLRNARFYGAEATLVIPGVVKPDVSYRNAWTQSRKHIEQLLPLAEELKIVMAFEETANQSKFLLSPLEFAQYIDDFRSSYAKAYFDTGNVMPIGYPQDWIHTLGHRIAKLHVKDYDAKTKQFVMPGDGTVDWPAVRQAFIAVGYSGTFTAELSPQLCHSLASGYLRNISRRMDRLLLG